MTTAPPLARPGRVRDRRMTERPSGRGRTPDWTSPRRGRLAGPMRCRRPGRRPRGTRRRACARRRRTRATSSRASPRSGRGCRRRAGSTAHAARRSDRDRRSTPPRSPRLGLRRAPRRDTSIDQPGWRSALAHQPPRRAARGESGPAPKVSDIEPAYPAALGLDACGYSSSPIEIRGVAVEPARHRPAGWVEQGPDRRHQQGADDRGVDGNGRRATEITQPASHSGRV